MDTEADVHLGHLTKEHVAERNILINVDGGSKWDKAATGWVIRRCLKTDNDWEYSSITCHGTFIKPTLTPFLAELFALDEAVCKLAEVLA